MPYLMKKMQRHQIISMLIRDRIFAKRVNIIGNEYQDLYKELAKTFKIEITNITANIEPFNETGVPIKSTPLSQILNTSKHKKNLLRYLTRNLAN